MRVSRWHQFVERDFLGRGGGEDTFSALVQADILGDAENPWAHSLGDSKLIKALEKLEHRFLCYLLGIFPLPAHQPAVLEDLGPKMFDKALKSALLSSQQPPG